MADPFEMKIDNRHSLAKLNKALRAMPTTIVKDAMDDAIFAAADVVVAKARQANFGYKDSTGRLRNTIKKQARKKKGRRFTNVIAGRRVTSKTKRGTATYPKFIELGTADQPARPFLFRAASETKDLILRSVADNVSRFGLKRAVEAARKRSGA